MHDTIEAGQCHGLMAISLIESQVRDRTKTVTRRVGWRMLRVGDQLTLCRKVMGRRCREPLNMITAADVAAEGFPQMTSVEFVAFFCHAHRGCSPGTEVTRIEWRYLD
jgi:hypothetical protein